MSATAMRLEDVAPILKSLELAEFELGDIVVLVGNGPYRDAWLHVLASAGAGQIIQLTSPESAHRQAAIVNVGGNVTVVVLEDGTGALADVLPALKGGDRVVLFGRPAALPPVNTYRDLHTKGVLLSCVDPEAATANDDLLRRSQRFLEYRV